MKSNLRPIQKKSVDFHDSLRAQLRIARKRKDAEACAYYADALASCCACASFERFKGSAAYENWKKANSDKIQVYLNDFKRFAYLWV